MLYAAITVTAVMAEVWAADDPSAHSGGSYQCVT